MNLFKHYRDLIAKNEYVLMTRTKLLGVDLKKLAFKLKMFKQIVVILLDLKKLFEKWIE